MQAVFRKYAANFETAEHTVFFGNKTPDKLLVKLQSGRQFQNLPHTSEIMGLEEAVDDAFCLKILVEEVVDRVPVELGVDLCALGVGGAVDGELLFDLAGARLVVLVEHAVRHKGILVTMDK